MNDQSSQDPGFAVNPEDKTTVLFMQVVLQLSSLATMLLGRAPHPDTGKTMRDLEAARLVIDQLEMLESKTKGNLGQDEEQLLRQTLMNLRMAYVEVINSPKETPSEKEEEMPSESTGPAAPEGASEQESKKRFTKKY